MEVSDLDTIVYGTLRTFRNAILEHVRARLTAEFGDDLDQQVKTLFQKEWSAIERSSSQSAETGAVSRTPVDALDHLSVSHLGTLVEKWWVLLCPDPTAADETIKRQKSQVFQWCKELTNVRNPIAHPAAESLGLPDSLRTVDTAARLAGLFRLPSEGQLRSTWDALIGTGAPDGPAPLLIDELPSREVITSEFVGRESHMADLFRWLGDPDRRTWLLAGDGGKGKTTIAYEFAARCRPVLCDFDLNGVVWMSAKKRRFADGATVATGGADFFDLESALDHLLDRVGVGRDPDLPLRDARQICRELLDEFPILIIGDDIDSLEASEEEAVEFLVHDVARTSSKVLMTSRRQHFGLGGCTTKIEGLVPEEVQDLMTRRAKAFGVDVAQITPSLARSVHSITDGSPLYIEDLLRFAGFYSMKRALNEWSGRGGDAARDYSMQRELEKLTDDARLCLGVLAFAEDPLSLEECAVIADLADSDAMLALEELTRWNLASKPGLIEDVPRFACTRNLAKLMRRAIADTDQELRIKNGLKGVQRGVAVSSSRVRSWNQQAVALKQRGEQGAAEETLLAGLEEVPNSAEILSQLGWLYSKWEPSARVADAAESFRKARMLGAMNRHLYAHWAEMELSRNEFRQAADLCEEAVESVCRSDSFLWRLGGKAYSELGSFYASSLSTDAAKKSYSRADQMLREAQKLAREDGDLSRTFNARVRLARSQHDPDSMKRVLEEWEKRLPDDPYRQAASR